MQQPRARSSRGGKAIQFAGIAGIVLCIALIVVTWLGRGTVAQAVDNVSLTVDTGIARAVATTDTVTGRLESAATSLGSIAADAEAFAANPTASAEIGTGLASRIGTFADGYRAARVRWSELKADIATAVTALKAIRDLVPTVDVPQAPLDSLAAIDAKLQSLDEALSGLWATLDAGPLTSAAATVIADKATDLQGLLTGASTTVERLSTDLGTLQTAATRAASNINTVILIGALALTLLLVWILLLNVALWKLGRTWKVQPASGPPAAVSAGP